MDALPLAALLGIFLVSAAVIWQAGIKLSLTTGILDVRWKLGSALGGLILLAIATSLPELAITVSAALTGHPEVAIGNLIGGIAIQTVVLAVLDGVVKERRPLSYLAGSLVLVLEAVLVIAITAVALMGTQLPDRVNVLGISPTSVVIAGLWVGGLLIVNRARRRIPWKVHPEAQPGRTPEQRAQMRHEHKLGKHRTAYVFGVFALAALVTLVAGVLLEETGTAIAAHLGIGSGVFAATVIAAATALPELSTGLASVKIGDHALAMSDIFGGNAFMPALFLLADGLAGKPTLPKAAATDIWLAGLGIIVTGAYAVGLVVRSKKQYRQFGLDSIAVIVLYVVGVVGLFLLS